MSTYQIEQFKSIGTLHSTLKKTKTTYHPDSSGEKEFFKNQHEKFCTVTQTFLSNQLRKKIEERSRQFNSQEKHLRKEPKLLTNPERKEWIQNKKARHISIEEVINKSLKITKFFYSNQESNSIQTGSPKTDKLFYEFKKKIYQAVIKILNSFSVFRSKQIVNHINLIFFSSKDVQMLKINEIQKHIIYEWRSNQLLVEVRKQWLLIVQKYLPLFQEQSYQVFQKFIYEPFCQYLSSLTYVIYKPYFQLLLEQNKTTKNEIIHRISKKSIRFIISQTSLYQNVVFRDIQKVIKKKFPISNTSDKNTEALFHIVIGEMKINSLQKVLKQLYSKNQALFPSTRPALTRFINQHFIPHKLKCIITIRATLQQDIFTYQKLLIEKGEFQDILILEKDEMITCLLLALISSHINLGQIAIALEQLKLMLGADIQNILRIYECPTYFTDLQAAIQFLILQSLKLK